MTDGSGMNHREILGFDYLADRLGDSAQMPAFFTHFYKIIINQGYIKGVNIHRFFWLNLFICLEFARTFRA